MDQKIVKRLEREIEEAITEVISRAGSEDLPLHPSRHTVHLMSKAAVTVFETAVENQRPRD